MFIKKTNIVNECLFHLLFDLSPVTQSMEKMTLNNSEYITNY